MLETEVANWFDDLANGNPRGIDAGAALVPVVDVGADCFDPFIARVPLVGMAPIGFWDLEGEVGGNPDTASKLDALVVEHGHEGLPCSDEVIGFAMGDVAGGFRFVMERQPDL